MGEDCPHLVASFGVRQTSVDLIFQRKTAPGTKIALIGYAVFRQEVIGANAEWHTGRIQLAVSHNDIVIVIACHRIVTAVDVTILDQHIVTGADIDSVLTAMDTNIADGNVLASENRVTPVAAVEEGVALKAHILTSPHADAVRTAVVVFSLRIVGIGAVNVRALFTDDSKIMGIQSADQGIAPTAGGNDAAAFSFGNDLVCSLTAIF